MESLSERAESDSRLAPAGAVSSQRGYDLAARLAKNGAAVDELVASCGITRHEAELLTRLHVHEEHASRQSSVVRTCAAASCRSQARLVLSVVARAM